MNNDKTTGAFFGMAVGDALGQATKGLKPETVRQHFKRMDGYKDVRPFIGKGIRQYRMQGLYGVPTQLALAVAESLVQQKGWDASHLSDLVMDLSVGGPENYWGVYRRPEGCFFKTVETLPERLNPEQADWRTAFGTYLPIGIVHALYARKPSATYLKSVTQATGFFTSSIWEIAGAAVTGWWVLKLASLTPEKLSREHSAALIYESAEFAEQAERLWMENFQAEEGPTPDALSRTFKTLSTVLDQHNAESLDRWIVENANDYLKTPVQHAAQGSVLTLLPLAIATVLLSPTGFSENLQQAVERGKESVKLGALVGAFAGALYGYENIPAALKKDLVNNKEIKSRAEALPKRKLPGNLKDLFSMEMGLTQKEAEEKRRYLPKEGRKPKKDKKTSTIEELWEEIEAEEDTIAQLKEDPAKWRQFERDKSKKKRDRRKGPSFLDD